MHSAGPIDNLVQLQNFCQFGLFHLFPLQLHPQLKCMQVFLKGARGEKLRFKQYTCFCEWLKMQNKYISSLHNKERVSLNKASMEAYRFRWAHFVLKISVISLVCCTFIQLKNHPAHLWSSVSGLRNWFLSHIYWSYIFVALQFITFMMFGFWVVKLITWIWLLLRLRAPHLRISCGATIPHIPAHHWNPLEWAPK